MTFTIDLQFDNRQSIVVIDSKSDFQNPASDIN